MFLREHRPDVHCNQPPRRCVLAIGSVGLYFLPVKSSRAILLFLRNAGVEARLKPMPQRIGVSGYDALNHRIARLAQRWANTLGADLIITGDAAAAIQAVRITQHGQSFGQRITNVVDDCRTLGYRHLLLLGNDCLDASIDNIAEAFATLEAGRSIAAAPAADGGSWMIGVDTEQIAREVFRALPWCTDQLFASLAALPNAAAVGQVRHDFDTWHSHEGRAALAQALGYRSRINTALAVQSYSPAPATRKALMRPSLPAPPTR